MGLFDKKNNKNEEPIEEKKEVSKVTFPLLTIVVDDVLSMTSTEVSVIGNIRGGKLHAGDELYVLGRKGENKKTRALRIEDTLMNKMDEADEGMNVSVVLEGLRQGDVKKYDVIASCNCMSADDHRPDNVVNPFLKGLLREHKSNREDREYFSRIMEYISNEGIFLTPMMHAPQGAPNQGNLGIALVKSKEGKMYLPAFTDIYELEMGPADLPEKIVRPIDFEQAKMIVEKSNAEGMIINPKSDGFALMKKTLDGLENVKKKIKNNLHEQKIDTSKPLMLAVPKDDHLPEDLFNAMRDYMKTEPRILRAWYGMMVFPEDKTRNHLVILDLLEEDPDIYGGVGRAAKDHVEEMQMNMQSYQKVGDKMVEKLKLFYERDDSIKSI